MSHIILERDKLGWLSGDDIDKAVKHMVQDDDQNKQQFWATYHMCEQTTSPRSKVQHGSPFPRISSASLRHDAAAVIAAIVWAKHVAGHLSIDASATRVSAAFCAPITGSPPQVWLLK